MFDPKFIAEIAVKTGRQPELVQSVASSIISELIASMLAGKEIEIKGFGTFGRRYLRPRQGFNPAKGVKIQLEGSYRPDFKFNSTFGNEFAEKLVNEPAPSEESEVPKVFDKVQIPPSALPTPVPPQVTNSMPPAPPAPMTPPPPPPPPVEEPEYHVAIDGNVSRMKRSQIPPGSLIYDGTAWVKSEIFLGQ